MAKVMLYIHGKNGNASEVEKFQKSLTDFDVVRLDYDEYLPWIVKEKIQVHYEMLKEKYDEVYVLANSIGAYFTIYALQNKNVEKASFISPIVDMEKLIIDMMGWANVTESELYEQKIIATDLGEELSWKYLQFTRDTHINWRVPTEILYAENDNLTSLQTITDFAQERENRRVTVMKNGEHWFHTDEQLLFLNKWLNKVT
nr:alpha/beta hydrolase [Liquorilactobacillus uvarum]